MEAVLGLDAAVAAARAIGMRFATASDDELLADGHAIEALGRLVDGWRIGFAAEAERRSSPKLGEQRPSFRQGVRDGVELVQLVAQVGHREAKQRVGLGAKLAPSVSIFGDVLPGRHPEVADAVAVGTIGVESARIIASTVEGMHRRVEPEAIDRMVASLLQLAAAADAEAVRDRAAGWSLAIDPDGDEPRERTQRRKRSLRFRQTLTDGTTSATLVLPPEDLAFLRELLAAQRRGRPLIRTEAGGDDDPEGEGPEWRLEGDDRTRPQHDFDTLMDALRAGATATEPAPPMHETVVTVTAAELEARQGRGWAPGVLAGIPIPVIERRACTGGMRLQVTGDTGEILHHGISRRLFSPAQRRALSVHAGGRCQFPGCRVPDPYLEAHHVAWWHRDGGPTDVGNGIMLCSFHHHLVHAAQSPVRIEHHDGAQHIVPRSWLGPPAAHQRVRTGPPFGGSAAPPA